MVLFTIIEALNTVLYGYLLVRYAGGELGFWVPLTLHPILISFALFVTLWWFFNRVVTYLSTNLT